MTRAARLSCCLIALSIVVSAQDSTTSRTKYLQERIRQVLGKAGVEIGGEFKSEYFSSTISGDGLNPAGRSAETNEYSSVDFDVIGRPNSSVSGQVIFRMHHNWQSFWSDPGNPIFSRWASIDGNFADKLRFHAGNFKALYSPLALYAPEVEILFEPDLFARRRVDAMNEEFLGGNARPLMGLTAGYDAPPLSVFDEIHFTILGARLRSIQTSLENGDYIVNSFEDNNDFNKLCVGSDLETKIRKRLALGGSFLFIFDDKGSFAKTATAADADTATQSTSIADVRAGYDLSKFCAMQDSSVRVYGEAAVSFDADAWYNSGDSNDLRRKTIKGSAAFGGIALQRAVGGVGFVDVDVKYVRNESNFRNELAQSPTFLGKRIMNIESDLLKGTVVPNHYSTFDALYNHVFKFCPSENTNLWEKAPFAKNAYTNNVYTQNRLAAIDTGKLDPSVQLVMPFGPATPNRQGVCVDFSTRSIATAVRVAGMLKLLKERSPEIYGRSATPAQFFQAGIGAECNGAAYLKRLHYPLVLSLSQVRSRVHVPESGFAITSDFTNAALTFQFWKKTALLGGFQFINNYFQNSLWSARQKQTHWSVGLSWQLAQSADVVGEIGRIMVENPNDLSATQGPQRFSKGTYTQYIGSIMLKAGF